MKSKSIRFLKLAALATLTGALFAPLFSGCRGVGYRHYPAPEQTDYSPNGTPLLTRQKGSALGVRILGLGVSPSMEEALDELYNNATRAGYRIRGKNYAFQNLVSENRYYLLYPVLGWAKLSVSADLYDYSPEGPNTQGE